MRLLAKSVYAGLYLGCSCMLAACTGGGGATTPRATPTLALFAGNMGGDGNNDGPAAVAHFNNPFSVAADSLGNVFVADSANHSIRKITPAGVVVTLAGTPGGNGSTDGIGTAAGFYYPLGLATDNAGDVYVADTGNHTIRKIAPDGVVSTLAGSPSSIGSNNGTGAAASFYYPSGVATDGSGNVYVADSAGDPGPGFIPLPVTPHSTIRKITPAGEVTTLAGTPSVTGSADGSGATAGFNFPLGIAADSAGNVYVADSGNNTIRKITPSGVVATLAGLAPGPGSADGAGAAAGFNHPVGVAIGSAGTIYVSDNYNATIRKITPGGEVSTLAGTPGVSGTTDGTGAAASFGSPYGIAADNAGNVYVTDSGSATIRKITPGGTVSTLAGTAGAIGSTDGIGAAASFNYPQGVAADGAGNIYVADSGNNTIRKLTPAGVVSTLAGTPGVSGSSDGTGAAASFSFPVGVACDSAGNIYVADSGNNVVRKITPAGVVSTVAGVVGVVGFIPGVLPGALSAPMGVAISGTSLYITTYNGVAVVNNVP